MATQTPQLSDIVLAAMDARLAGVYTAMPGIIQSYDASIQSADVQPAVRNRYLDETDSTVVETLPIIPVVPVVFAGGGGYRTTYPVAKGDSCLVIFANCSIDRWLRAGGVVDPQDDRRHTLNDAFAIVGLKDYGHALRNAPTDRMSLGYDTGPTIEMTPTEVRVGGNDANAAVVVQSALDLFMSGLTSAIAAAVPNDGGHAALTALQTKLKNGGSGWDAGTSVTKAK